MVLLFIVLTGCQITPRYHQRGLSLSWRSSGSTYAVKPFRSELKMGRVVTEISADSGCYKLNSGDVKSVELLKISANNESKRIPCMRVFQMDNKHSNKLNPKPKSKNQSEKERRAENLELGSMISYSVGAILLLLSWWILSDTLAIFGMLAMAVGFGLLLENGLMNIKHRYTIWMSVVTLLGLVYILAKTGLLLEFIAAILK